jgi:hypothetical protein
MIYHNYQKPRTVREAFLLVGHDEDFEPQVTKDFHPTDAPAGSPEKVEILRKRVDLGQPLWHEGDRDGYDGFGLGNQTKIGRMLSIHNDTGPGIRVCQAPMNCGKTLS